MNKIILSYCRVSTYEQSSEGAGLDNQRYKNNIAIEQLQIMGSYTRIADMVEIGSAYKGNNLLTIIDNAKAGLYPQGSVIVMFDLTRFSRTDFIDAANKMRELLDTGIHIHFSASNETLTRESLRHLGGFVSLLAKAEAANKESKSRSDRALASYANKINNGEIVAVGHIPNWIKKVYDISGHKPKIIAFELIPERQQTIAIIFNNYIGGQGVTTITGWLNKNIPPWDGFDSRRIDKSKRVWRESYVTKLLFNKAIIGYRIFNVGRDNESYRENYYPAAISKATWYKAQEIRKHRPKGTTGGFNHPVNFLSGLCFCGYCGSRYGVQNFNTGRRSVIRCTAYAKKEVSTELCAGGSSAVRFLERVVIEFCNDESHLAFIFNNESDNIMAIKDAYSGAVKAQNDISNKLTKLEDLYFNDDITKERYKIRKVNFEVSLKESRARVDKLKTQIDAYSHTHSTDEDEIRQLLLNLKQSALTGESRLKLRDLLPIIIDKITVYRYGYSMATKCRDVIVYGLYFKSGYGKTVWFDTKKEVWVGKDL